MFLITFADPEWRNQRTQLNQHSADIILQTDSVREFTSFAVEIPCKRLEAFSPVSDRALVPEGRNLANSGHQHNAARQHQALIINQMHCLLKKFGLACRLLMHLPKECLEQQDCLMRLMRMVSGSAHLFVMAFGKLACCFAARHFLCWLFMQQSAWGSQCAAGSISRSCMAPVSAPARISIMLGQHNTCTCRTISCCALCVAVTDCAVTPPA